MSAWRAVLCPPYDMHACFMATFYILLVTEALDYALLWKVLALITSLGLYFVYGFLINDFFDIPTDKMAGKGEEIHNMPRIQTSGLLLLVVLLSYAVTLLLIGQPLYTLTYVIAYFLGMFYSAPPLRFKCRGVYGIAINVLIEKALPVLLIISFFRYFTLDAIFLVILFSLWQLELIVIHQYVDYEADLKARVRTFVTQIGFEKTLKILKILQPLVASLFIFFSLVIITKIPYSIIFFILVVIGFFLLNKLRSSNLFATKPGDFGPPRFYAEEDKVGDLRRSLSSFLGAYFAGPFPLFAGVFLTWRFTPYIILLLLSITSQYYFIRGHYHAVFRGAYLLVKRKTVFS